MPSLVAGLRQSRSKNCALNGRKVSGQSPFSPELLGILPRPGGTPRGVCGQATHPEWRLLTRDPSLMQDRKFSGSPAYHHQTIAPSLTRARTDDVV